MTENLAQLLRASKIRTSINVTGIGETQTSARLAAVITITPSASEIWAYSTTALILKSLTRYMPIRVNSPCYWSHLGGLKLADPDPTGSDPIDLKIGADLFGSLLLNGIRKGTANEPIAQDTVLGWIISGPTGQVQAEKPTSIGVHHTFVDDDLDFNLRRFWEVEEVPRTSKLSLDDQACEEYFLHTHSRDRNGRYIVRLPFKTGPPISIGESRNSALQQYLRSEKRLKRDPSKAAAYNEFLKEYADLGHMQRVPDTEKLVIQRRSFSSLIAPSSVKVVRQPEFALYLTHRIERPTAHH